MNSTFFRRTLSINCVRVSRALTAGRVHKLNSLATLRTNYEKQTIRSETRRYFSIGCGNRFSHGLPSRNNELKKPEEGHEIDLTDIDIDTLKVKTKSGEESKGPEVMYVKMKKSGKNPLGYFNITGLALFLIGLAYLVNYRRKVQKAVDAYKAEKDSQSFGKALIGGAFTLTDTNGNLFTEADLKNKFSLIYFGFTLCPDICPEELDKMAIIVKELKTLGIDIQPIFITCDPLRDTAPVVKKYLEEFDIPGIVGLTGTYREVEATCKAFRVYFSTPPDVKPGDDYIVDHSIFFYLMDPEGEFVNVFGRRYNAEEATEEIGKKIREWLPLEERKEIAFQKPSFWKFWE
ncbi:SCO1/SenC-domain-containing protein [Lipomyces oligophaga]|uniref:SCO1/SenC-domain-containing protein n=1 Tax=Lipomyces oligophaga TaxID=45792 RepID=UPI0034CFDF93